MLLSNGVVSWLRKKQLIIILCQLQKLNIEYSGSRISLVEKAFGVSQDQPSVIMEDNQRAICIAIRIQLHTQEPMHIGIYYSYHYI